MSSADSEYMAACSVCMTATHIHMMAYDFNHLGTTSYDKTQVSLPNPPMIIMCDNQAAVHMAKNDQITKRNCHISRRFHYVRQGITQNEHKFSWIGTKFQQADPLTKPGSATIFGNIWPYQLHDYD